MSNTKSSEELLEELENSISMLSFEDELKQSEPTHDVYKKSSRIVSCKVCGTQVLVGPDDVFKCPNYPHDGEDDCEIVTE